MEFFKYFLSWLRNFFIFFGAWAMFYMISNVPLEQSFKILISASVFGLILSIVVVTSDILEKHKDR